MSTNSNIINYNIIAFCEEHVLKTNFMMLSKFLGHFRWPLAK